MNRKDYSTWVSRAGPRFITPRRLGGAIARARHSWYDAQFLPRGVTLLVAAAVFLTTNGMTQAQEALARPFTIVNRAGNVPGPVFNEALARSFTIINRAGNLPMPVFAEALAQTFTVCNNAGGDGCRGDCSAVEGVCGDGTLDPICEACDNGNLADGDGCSSTCTVEPGFVCVGEPSVCSPVCAPPCVNGTCTAPDTCTCSAGWVGATCDIAVCTLPCVNGTCTAPDTCTCDAGWTGPECSTPVCDPACINGTCTAPDTCTCDPGWTGADCSTRSCEGSCVCSTVRNCNDTFTVSEGGCLVLGVSGFVFCVEPGDLAENTPLCAAELQINDPDVDVSFGPGPGLGVAVALFDLQPDGLVFASPNTLTIPGDVSNLNANQQSRLDLFFLEEAGNKFDSIDADCCVDEEAPGIFTAVCSAEISHFST